MTIDAPGEDWLPLRQAVLRYQRSEAAPDLEAPELVLRLLELAAASGGLHDFEYDEETETFYVSSASGMMASYRLGDPEIGRVFPREVTAEEAEAISTAISDLLQRFEKLFQKHSNRGLFRTFARVGSPLATSFTEIPPDALAQFKITDWRLGNMACGPQQLYSVHCAEPSVVRKAISSPIVQKLSRDNQQARFARYLLTYHDGIRPVGSWAQVRDDYKEKTGKPEHLDEKTMRDGAKLADEAKREGIGIPAISRSPVGT
jgi:hypothetical protein